MQFTSAISTGDSIALPASGKFTEFVGNKSSNRSINATDGATTAEWEEYLRNNLAITLNGVSTKSIRMIASFDPVGTLYDYNATNGHYYETVQTNVNWEVAYEAAKKKTYMGMQGYLVTVTSQQEHDYVYTMIKANCWMGATCWDTYTNPVKNTYAEFYASQGITIPASTYSSNPSTPWYFWVSGPEAGKLISKGGLGSQVAAPDPEGGTMFTNWASGEPNNSSGEFCAHFFSTQYGLWNDYVNTSKCFYVIEYGGMESDEDDDGTISGDGSADVNVDVYVKVDIDVDPSGKTITTEADDITVGQPLSIKENANGGDVETIVSYDEDGERITVPATITRQYYQLKEGGNANKDADWILMDTEPTEPGTYKVVSSAVYKAKDADIATPADEPFTSGSATFKIKKHVVDVTAPALPASDPSHPGGTTPDGTKDATVTDEDGNQVIAAGRTYAKTYDGNNHLAGGTINLSDVATGTDQVYLTYEYGEYVTTDAGKTELVLHGVEIHGANKDYYQLRGLGSDGTLTVTGVIQPRDLVVTSRYGADAANPISVWEKSDPFTDAYANNVVENAIDSVTGSVTGPDGLQWPTAWPANMLAPGDTIADVLGEVAYEATGFNGEELNRDNPQIGTYVLTPTFEKVVQKDGQFYTENGNYRVIFNKARLEVQPHPKKNLTPNGPIEVTDKTHEGDPIGDDDIKKIIEDALGTQPTPGGVPSDIEPEIVITKGGVVYPEIDPTEPGEYTIKVTYPDPEGGDVEVDVIYVVEKDPTPSDDENFFRISTTLKGATAGASITPTQTVAKGGSATVSWTPGDGAYVALVEVDGKTVTVGGSYDFSQVSGDHEVVVTLVAKPVLPTSTNNGFYTVTVNKYGGATGVDVSPSQVLAPGDNAVVTWTPQPGYEVTSVLVNGKALDADTVASGAYPLPEVGGNYVVDVYFAPTGSAPSMSQTDMQVSTKIVGGPGSITGGSTVALGDDYTVNWEPVIQTVPDYTSPDYAVYEVTSVKVNGEVAADNDDRTLTLSDIRENKEIEVRLAPVLYTVSVLSYGPGSASDTRSFFKGQRYVDITGTPDEGSHISYIEVDGEVVFDESAGVATVAAVASAGPEVVKAAAQAAIAQEVPTLSETVATVSSVAASFDAGSEASSAEAAGTATEEEATAAEDAAEVPDGAEVEEVADEPVPLFGFLAKAYADEAPQAPAKAAAAPVFEDPATSYKQADGAGLGMTIAGINQAHTVKVYFANDGEVANPDTVRDAGDTITVVPAVEGSPGTITGGGVIPVGEDDPKPTFTWDLPEGYQPTGVWIDDEFYPVDPDATEFVWPEGLEPEPNHEYTLRLETEKRAPGDDQEPERQAASEDGAGQQYLIATTLRGGSGTITGNVQVSPGASHTVEWTAGEADGVKYRVAKVIIDGVERPDLVNAGRYTFDDVAAGHTVEVVLERVPDDPTVKVPEGSGESGAQGDDASGGSAGSDSSGGQNGSRSTSGGEGDGTTAVKTETRPIANTRLAQTGDTYAAPAAFLVCLAAGAVALIALRRRTGEE